MKKYIICADLYGYAEVEAENEDEAWEKGKELPFSAFEVSNTIFDIVIVEEEWDVNAESDNRLCRTYTSRGEEWSQIPASQQEEYNYLFDEDEALWLVECEVVKKPGRVAKELGFDPIYASYETHYLIDALAELPEKNWKGMAPKDENDWGVTLAECMAAAREARAPVNERKRQEYDAYYRAYAD